VNQAAIRTNWQGDRDEASKQASKQAREPAVSHIAHAIAELEARLVTLDEERGFVASAIATLRKLDGHPPAPAPSVQRRRAADKKAPAVRGAVPDEKTDAAVLAYLEKHGPVRPRDVETTLKLTPWGSRTVLDRLSHAGKVVLEGKTQSRRVRLPHQKVAAKEAP
jgi:hypothetical protein